MADDAKISESPKSGQIYSGAYRNSRKRRKSLAAANTDIASVSLRPNSIIPGGPIKTATSFVEMTNILQ